MKAFFRAWGATLLVIFCAAPAWGQLPRNCPKVADQLVLVPLGQPAAFRLTVTNLGNTPLSVFQPPLGGTLQATGPSPLDYVFVPNGEFRGTTYLRYRIVPQEGCDQSATIATVTLAGPTLPAAESLDDRNQRRCGLNVVPLFVLTAAFIGFSRRRRSR